MACGPGPISGRGARRAFALGGGGLRLGLRGAAVPDELAQELELGQEELPDDKPTEQHEEQRARERGHDDQQREPDALPHREPGGSARRRPRGGSALLSRRGR